MKATTFFANSRNEPTSDGDGRCFYCGGSCCKYSSVPASKHVKKSFTARDTIAGGQYVCGGCIAAMNERGTLVLPDGEEREGQKIRCYSWVITPSKATAATKAHREWLRGACLSPPDPPYVISISDSGQKHLLYLATVNYDNTLAAVWLEGERISYRPTDLSDRVRLSMMVSAAVGRPDRFDTLVGARMAEYYGSTDESFEAIESWIANTNTPLTRLAVWLTPAKKECKHEFPKFTG